MRILILSAALGCLGACCYTRSERVGMPEGRPWRGGWAHISRDPGALIACAKELEFNALIVGGDKERLRSFSEMARSEGIECYYWFSIGCGKGQESLRQEMSPEDVKCLEDLLADSDPRKHGYQFGGEPRPGRHEVLQGRLLCFHRSEVVEYCKTHLREVLEACPDLAGVAFDYFGYQNYRCCHCPHSMELFEEYAEAHPELPRQEALDRFSLETLVAFNNDLAAHVRKVRPGAKIATHVYPTYLPEPLYGNRLDLDYCCQTVAWFFEPYWADEKIARHTRVVVNEAKKYHPRARGIPFVGVYVGRPVADKPPDRLARELRIIRETAGTAALSVYNFNEFVGHEEMRQVVKDWLGK